MGRIGFIHDKLDIKFLILYIASRLIEPVGIDVLTDLALCDDGVDYFSFSECLNELVDSEHMKRTEDGLYCATPRGIRNSEVCDAFERTNCKFSVFHCCQQCTGDCRFSTAALRRCQYHSTV